MNKGYTDDKLLALLKKDPERGVTLLYDLYWKILLDAAYKRLQDEQESQEIVQELFVSIFIQRNELTLHSGFEVYLRNAVKYKVLNYFRHQITREKYARLVASDSYQNNLGADRRLEETELAFRLRNATQLLPPKCREVFVLSKIEGFSNIKIAERLGISISTVEKHLSKGMKLMRKHLGESDDMLITLAILLFASINCKI